MAAPLMVALPDPLTRRAPSRLLPLVVLVLANLCAVWLAWEASTLPADPQTLRALLFVQPAAATQTDWIPLHAMASTLPAAVIYAEDPTFYQQGAVNWADAWRAFGSNVRAGHFVRDGRSITQRVVQRQFLGREKTLVRKVHEVILAQRVERVASKDEILTVYLNVAEWGDGVVGAQAAARRYFGKPASRLDWAEAALLAGILPKPRAWNPCVNPGRAREQRGAVLDTLFEHGKIDEHTLREASAAPLPACTASH